jgi:23S rRNA (guanosine2251-2'-O)-methyltransferase
MSNSKSDRGRRRHFGRSGTTRAEPPNRLWLYGRHAVFAALENPARQVHRLLVTPNTIASFPDRLRTAEASAATGTKPDPKTPPATPVERVDIDRLLPPGAVHQGIAAEVSPLPAAVLADICPATDASSQSEASDRCVVIVLDKVTDPRNVGAVLRSAAAFGAAAVVVPARGAPEATGVLAKAASGALETVPLVRAGNLRSALETLKAAGFWCVGLAAAGDHALAETDLSGKIALILGAEGGGLRRLTRESCDFLASIPISSAVESLNISNAAAIALYEWCRAGRAE